MKWLPIESAPKDGTHVIVCIAKLQRSQGEAFWWQDDTGSGGWQTWDGENNRRTVYTTPPTHWMPLPEPPGSEPSQHDQAKAIMDKMTDEQRLSLMQEYCIHCGTKHTPCYCTRDD